MVGLPRNYKLKGTDQSRKGGKDCYAGEDTAYGCSTQRDRFLWSLMYSIRDHREGVTEEREL